MHKILTSLLFYGALAFCGFALDELHADCTPSGKALTVHGFKPYTNHVQVGELQEALDAIKWGVDYLLNCHTEPMKFVAMYGSSEVRRHSAPASSHTAFGDTCCS